MEKSFLLRHSLLFLVLLFLFFPVWFLSTQFHWNGLLWDPSLVVIAQGAFVQALLSTLVTIVLGGVSSLGLHHFFARSSKSLQRLAVFMLILPSFMPPILLIILTVKGLSFLPVGLWAVVFFHVLMNVGVVSLLILRFIEQKAVSWIQWSQVAGVSTARFLWRVLIPGLRSELNGLIFYLFILYFFSFSVPLLVGGHLYSGIEVFLYEKVLFLGDWVFAIQYGIWLFLVFFLINHFLQKDEEGLNLSTSSSLRAPFAYLGSWWWGLIALLPGVFVLLAIFVASLSLKGWGMMGYYALRGTFIVGLSVGLIVFVVLTCLTYIYAQGRWQSLLSSIVNPGWVIAGFALMLLPGEGVFINFCKMSVALSIVYIPFLLRLSFFQTLQNLQAQVVVTSTMSVPWRKAFLQILWPQILPRIAFLSGLAALWACGDFAMTGLFAKTPEVTTLGYEMKVLLSNYRGDQALGLVGPLILCGVIVFFSFQGLHYVSSQKT